MKLSETKEFVDYLLSEGASPDMPVCLFDGEEVIEIVAEGRLLSGEYYDDPPKGKDRSAVLTNGQFILLSGCSQSIPDNILNTPKQLIAIEEPIEYRFKTTHVSTYNKPGLTSHTVFPKGSTDDVYDNLTKISLKMIGNKIVAVEYEDNGSVKLIFDNGSSVLISPSGTEFDGLALAAFSGESN